MRFSSQKRQPLGCASRARLALAWLQVRLNLFGVEHRVLAGTRAAIHRLQAPPSRALYVIAGRVERANGPIPFRSQIATVSMYLHFANRRRVICAIVLSEQ